MEQNAAFPIAATGHFCYFHQMVVEIWSFSSSAEQTDFALTSVIAPSLEYTMARKW